MRSRTTRWPAGHGRQVEAGECTEVGEDEGSDGAREIDPDIPSSDFGTDVVYRAILLGGDFLKRIPQAGLEPDARPVAVENDVTRHEGRHAASWCTDRETLGFNATSARAPWHSRA